MNMQRSGRDSNTHENKRRRIEINNPYSEIIYILIGIEQAQFAVHVSHLTKASGVFRRILQEADADVKLEPEPGSDYDIILDDECYCVCLPNENPDTFKHVNQWLYTQRITESDEKAAKLTWDTIFDIYVFALRRDIPGLQNAIVDASITKHQQNHNTFPTPSQINRLYSENIKATKVAPFRKLFVDILTLSRGGINDGSDLSSLHPQFLSAVILALDKIKTTVTDEVRVLKEKRAKRQGKEFKEDGRVHFSELKEQYYVQIAPIELD